MNFGGIVKFELIAVFAFLHCTAIMAFPQSNNDLIDRETVLAEVRKNWIGPEELFLGDQIEMRITIETHNSDGPQLLTTSTFNQLDKNAWRCDSVNGDHHLVIVRDGSFAFEAEIQEIGGKFQFGVMGFDQQSRASLLQSMLVRGQLLWTPTHVFSIELLEFLSTPTVNIESLTPAIAKCGKRSQVIKWTLGKCEKYPRPAFGEIVWLPDNGYLIERCSFTFGIPSPEQKESFVFETTFDEKAGRLLPLKTIRQEVDVTYRTERLKHSACDTDRNFYSAEALGLQTPRNPKYARLMWGMLAILFLVLAVISFVTLSRRSKR